MQKIQAIAAKYITRYNIWKEKRIYIYDCRLTAIYNTNKCEQTVYIDLNTFYVSCYTNCPSQGSNWINNENARVREALMPLARLMRIATGAQRVATQSVEVIMNNAVLDAEPVAGYYTEWRSVRVAINRFGKLADRNRQFVVAFKGTKATAPKGFTELTQAGYDYFIGRYNGEQMLEPYTSAPDYNQLAQLAQSVSNN